MGVLDDFDVDNEAQDDFADLPDGVYAVIISSGELKDKDYGKNLSLTLQVIEGDHQNRLVWDNLNIVHTSPDAQKFSRAALAGYCKAIGVNAKEMGPAEEGCPGLWDKPLRVKLRTKGDFTNVVKRIPYGNDPNAGGDTTPSAPPAAQSDAPAATPAWMNQNK